VTWCGTSTANTRAKRAIRKWKYQKTFHLSPCFPATLAVARKLVAYLLAVDKSSQAFRLQLPAEEPTQETA
jgi:hypothetical protein